MVSGDTTFDLLRRLDDPLAWDHVDRGICVFREHTSFHYNPETKKEDLEVVYDRPKLERFLERLLDLQKNYGSCPIVILGHTKPKSEVTEEDQPDPVGYWANPRIVEWGPNKLAAIAMDRFILPGKWEEAKKYPFRSVEFFPEEYAKLFPGSVQPEAVGAITAVALLKTPPKLDMGTTLYQKCFPLCYARFDWGETMPDPTTIPGVDEKKRTADDMDAQFKACMSRTYPHLPRYYSERIRVQYERPEGDKQDDDKKDDDKKEPEKEKMSATVPTVPPNPAPSAVEEQLRQMKSQFEGLQAQYDRAAQARDAEMTAIKAKLTATEHEKVLAVYERELFPHSLIFQFDLATEVADSCKDASGAPISREQFEKVLKRVQRYQRRGPTDQVMNQISVGGQTFTVVDDAKITKPQGDTPKLDVKPEDAMACGQFLAQYAAKHQEMNRDAAHQEALAEFIKSRNASKPAA